MYIILIIIGWSFNHPTYWSKKGMGTSLISNKNHEKPLHVEQRGTNNDSLRTERRHEIRPQLRPIENVHIFCKWTPETSRETEKDQRENPIGVFQVQISEKCLHFSAKYFMLNSHITVITVGCSTD